MESIVRKYINWKKTGKKLKALREHNLQLIRYACYVCHFDVANCDGNCETCNFDVSLDNRITRKELAKVFDTGESVIVNWENGDTPVPLDDLFLYCQISGKELKDIIAY